MAPKSDSLLRRAQHLEPAAWSEIYDQLYPRVYAFLLTRVHDAMLAEDLAADVFVNALRAIGSYEDRGLGLTAWLFRIANNRLKDYYRRQAVRPQEDLETIEETLGAHGDVPLPVEFDLQTALQHLKPEQRQILHLRFVEGLTSVQVAQVLDKTEAAVKIAQHRALKALRLILKTG
jgi:RNA polymerase sigma-70 factor (ECF subfamily)